MEGLEQVSKRASLLLTGLVLVAACVLGLAWLQGMPPQADEHHHARQVRAFCDGDLRLDRKITMVPGWHLLAAGVARLTGDCSLLGLRRMNAGLGLLSGLAFFWASLAVPSRYPGLRSVQYFLCPILFPYQFLAYTEIGTLLLLLLAAGFLLRGRSVAAGLVVCASLLLRQTNVVWLLLVVLYVLLAGDDSRERGGLVRRLWPCVLGLLGFGLFVVDNGGIALGDAQAHRAGFYMGNVWFTLLLLALVFLPHNLFQLWDKRASLLAWWRLALAGLVGGWFLAEFGPEHGYNRFPGFARNALLVSAENDLSIRAWLLLPLLVGLFALLVTRLQRPALCALYPVALLSLLPIRLIDQRYSFPFLALFLLFREDDPPPVEVAGVVASALLTAALTRGLARQAFLL